MFADPGLSEGTELGNQAAALHRDGIIGPRLENLRGLEDKHLITHGSVGIVQGTEGRVVLLHPIDPHILDRRHLFANVHVKIAPLAVDHFLQHGHGHGATQLPRKLLLLKQIDATSNLPHQLDDQINGRHVPAG